jgi:hypothetical protein
MMKHEMIFAKRNAMRAVVLGLGVAASSGCGDDASAPSSLKTYPVKGKVVLADGKPLSSGVVVFAQPEKGMEFEAPLESDGSFAVKSSYGEGAPEGSYKIRIQSDVSKPGEAKPRPRRAANAPYNSKYSDETSSGLTAEVKPTDNSLEPFTLAK